MSPRLQPLSRGTLEAIPAVCQDCVWWQGGRHKAVDKQSWIAQVEEQTGSWGSLYSDDDGRLLGLIQYGPASFFPRSRELPAGPASADAFLITCSYLVERSSPWVIQSLLLAAIGQAKKEGARALEAFAYRYRQRQPFERRFLSHRTVFPHDLLADLGFIPIRNSGRLQLARLELSGLEPGEEPAQGLWSTLKRLFWPEPVPAPPRP